MSTLKLQFKKIRTFKRRKYSDLERLRNFYQQWHRSTKSGSFKFPLEVLYLRNSDIPQYLIDGVVDIVGDNY
jgi:ATP phosphoribosyltransferase